MPDYSVEITGELGIQYGAYLDHLSNAQPTEPRLIELLRRFGPNSDLADDPNRANAFVEEQLYELLRSYETDVARSVRLRLENQHWRRYRRGPGMLRDDDEEALFHVNVRFGRGSLLFTLVVTVFEAAGPMVAKGALASLVAAAVEPILLDKVRYICKAGQTITSSIREVLGHTALEPAAAWADDSLSRNERRFARKARKLHEARPSRMMLSFLFLVTGISMANFAALAAVLRKMGVF